MKATPIVPPLRSPVTICIAAVCEMMPDRDPKIVVCTDGKASGPLGSKEFVIKARLVVESWRLLTAGGESDVNALLLALKAEFKALDVIDEATVGVAASKALQTRKLQRCDEYTLGRYGIPYSDFMKEGKQRFPEETFRSDMFAIGKIEPKIDCILAGFTDAGFPLLLKLEGSGKVAFEEDFAVSGEGEWLAQSGLIHRRHTEQASLATALYNAYEAKRYAEREP